MHQEQCIATHASRAIVFAEVAVTMQKHFRRDLLLVLALHRHGRATVELQLLHVASPANQHTSIVASTLKHAVLHSVVCYDAAGKAKCRKDAQKRVLPA